MGGKWINKGQAGNFGPHGSASDFTMNQQVGGLPADFGQIASALADLIGKLPNSNVSPNSEAVEDLKRAHHAACQDSETTMLSWLKASGKWALDAATRTGTTFAVAVIEHALKLK